MRRIVTLVLDTINAMVNRFSKPTMRRPERISSRIWPLGRVYSHWPCDKIIATGPCDLYWSKCIMRSIKTWRCAAVKSGEFAQAAAAVKHRSLRIIVRGKIRTKPQPMACAWLQTDKQSFDRAKPVDHGFDCYLSMLLNGQGTRCLHEAGSNLQIIGRLFDFENDARYPLPNPAWQHAIGTQHCGDHQPAPHEAQKRRAVFLYGNVFRGTVHHRSVNVFCGGWIRLWTESWVFSSVLSK